jgi:hypothetical protein
VKVGKQVKLGVRMQQSFEQAIVPGTIQPPASVPRSRLLLLFLIFFFICSGLGYPILNRIDWRQGTGGLDDVVTYAGLVTTPPAPDLNQHMQFRILVPYLARPIYRMAKNHLGSWDPIMFGLLVVNSFFVALTVTLLLIVVHGQLGSYPVALGSALIYLLNFAVPNLRLAGMIDAGEAFFLMAVVWSLCNEDYWMLPLWAVAGATAKESFVPFLMVFSFSWWLCSRRDLRRPSTAAIWMVTSWIAGLGSLAALQWKITHVFRSPLRFGLDLHQHSAYLEHFLLVLGDRNLWYIFFWLLPLSLLRLRRLPRNWRVATAATSATAFALDAYYGGSAGTVGRALFSIAGPLLCASVAILLFTDVSSATLRGPDGVTPSGSGVTGS